MNANDLNAYLAKNQLEDSWWVVQDGAWLESVMTLAQIEELDGVIQVLHETHGDKDPPPVMDFKKKLATPPVARKAVASTSDSTQEKMMNMEPA